MGHSLCHNPLDIVGIEGGVPALLRAGVIHREELKHTHTHTPHQDLKARGDHPHPLFPKLQGLADAHSHTQGSYLHIHDAAGLSGCEPEDLESKKRKTSDAHQSLNMGSSHPKQGNGEFLPTDIKMQS